MNFFGHARVVIVATAAVCIISFGLEAPASAAVPQGYRIYQSIPLRRAVDGVNGALELVQDERITENLRAKMHGSDRVMYCYDDTLAVLCESIRRVPLKPTLVRLVNAADQVVDSREFERELGTMQPFKLYGESPRAFAVTIDFSAGFGSYNGEITFFGDIRAGRLRWLKAQRSGGGDEEMTVMTSLKTAWKLVKAGNGAGMDILKIACRPNFASENDFDLTYTRFAFDGKRWIRYERTKPGFWEQGSFPALEEFP
ncbi:MAG TPA: hypothetical protein VGH16_03605 [Candidatus Binatia bacterium]